MGQEERARVPNPAHRRLREAGCGRGRRRAAPAEDPPRPPPPAPPRHSHNHLRITRILKSLGELGLERYQAPLVRFFLEETLVRRELPAVRRSALDYFVFTVRCPRQRRALLRFAWAHFRPRRLFVWAPHHKLRGPRPRAPPLPGPEPAADPLLQAGAPGRTCGPGSGAGGAPQEEGAREGGPGAEGPAPASPTESKKRKLEPSRAARAAGELGPQGASEVEAIARNLEGCALSQGGPGAGTQERGGQGPGEPEQPCPPPPGATAADEVRKRRKVDQAPAPSGRPEAGAGEAVEEDEAEGQAVPEQGAPGSPAAAEPASEERAEAGLAAGPPTP